MIGYTGDIMGLDCKNCENHVITVCHDIADSLGERVGIDAIIIGNFKTSD